MHLPGADHAQEITAALFAQTIWHHAKGVFEQACPLKSWPLETFFAKGAVC